MQSACIDACKMEKIISQCGCASAMETQALKSPNSTVPYCIQDYCNVKQTMSNLACLATVGPVDCSHCRYEGSTVVMRVLL